jgi:tetratricopeptide (TPR) repeat protein
MHIRCGIFAAGLALGMIPAVPVAAEVNCANEFRSGKLYFSQSLFEKSTHSFKNAAEACPEKGEYRARYGMALCEVGKEYLGRLVGALPEERDTLLTRALECFEKAGSEFDAALLTEDGQKRKLQKFVEDNRGHYWVDEYNQALELFEEGNYVDADIRFRVNRMLNSKDILAYTQGAITLIRLEKSDEALALVESGLEIDPQDERLNTLKTSILHESARRLANQAETDDNPALLKQAIVIFDQLLDRDPEDPNMYYERGLAALSGAGVVAKEDEAGGKAMYARAVADFTKAAEMVPADGENREFHVNCLFYIVQAWTNAGEVDKALEAGRDYLCLSPMDALGWQFMVINLLDRDDQTGVVSSLMMKKSLEGEEIPVQSAVDAAKGASQEAFDTLGKPDHVHTYQEDSTQIQTWIWLKHNKAIIFTLPAEKSGEVAWCRQG